MKPTVEVSDLPADVIVPVWLRMKIYLTAFLIGIALDATVAGWFASETPIPKWLIVAVVVYGSLSKSWAILARANTTPVRRA